MFTGRRHFKENVSSFTSFSGCCFQEFVSAERLSEVFLPEEGNRWDACLKRERIFNTKVSLVFPSRQSPLLG